MSQILLITSSPRSNSYSTRAAQHLAEKLQQQDPGSKLIVRDLNRDPLPHIDDTFATARNQSAEKLTPEQRSALTLSDELLQELFASDVIIISAAMINFGIPSTLKAYIDYIVRPGVSFRYSEKGPEGLIKGKKVYLVVARGGVYSQGPMQSYNFQDTYLRAVLGFIGMTDVEVIAVEGVAFGAEAAEKAFSQALSRVSALAA
jgi:FMN-dependent NADH-azoreductase